MTDQERELHPGFAKAAAGALAVLPCIIFWRALLPGYTFLTSDIPLVFAHTRSLLRQMGEQGRIFLWNPWIFCGEPLLGNINAAMLYPLNALHYLLPVDRALSLYTLLHFSLAGASMWILLRAHRHDVLASFAGGLTFALSGFAVVHLSRPPFLGTYAWFPLTLAVATWYLRDGRPRWVATQALLFALLVLAGSPQILCYLASTYVICVLASSRRAELRHRIAIVGIAPLLGIVVAGVQVLPFLELAAVLPRTHLADPGFSTHPGPWSLSDLPGMLLPEVHPQTIEMTSEATIYLGLLPVLLGILALANKPRRAGTAGLLALAGVTFVLAMGNLTPLGNLLPYLPVFNKSRIPARLLCIPAFCLAATVPASIEWLRRRGQGALAALTVACLTAELISQSLRHTHIAPYSSRLRDLPRSLQTTSQPRPRMVALPGTEYDYANRGMQWQVSSLVGIESLALDSYIRYILHSELGRLPTQAEISQCIWDAHFVGLKNLRSNKVRLLHLGYILRNQAGCAVLEKMPEVFPYAFLAPTYRVMAPEEQLACLEGAGFRPLEEVLLEAPPAALAPPLPAVEVAREEVCCQGWSEDRIDLHVSSCRGGWLVVSEPWFPGWEAQVDGHPAPLLRANTVLRCVRVQPGAHEVSLRYRPGSLRLGALLSLAGLLGVGILIAADLRRGSLRAASTSSAPEALAAETGP